MQDHEQKEHLHLHERVGYLNPLLICQDSMQFKLDDKQQEVLNAIEDPKEREEALRTMTVHHDIKFAFYMGHAMLEFKDRQCIMAPYNFK